MAWFNYWGLLFIVLLLLPNIIWAVKQRSEPNKPNQQGLEISEQIGRYGTMFFMVFNLPFTYLGFYLPFAKTVYIIVNAILILAYLIIWAVMWRRSGMARALLLSIIPSLLFVFSGVMIANIPLVIFALLFATTHIWLSVKNVPAVEARLLTSADTYE